MNRKKVEKFKEEVSYLRIDHDMYVLEQESKHFTVTLPEGKKRTVETSVVDTRAQRTGKK